MSTPGCTDVCEIIIGQLRALGFNVNDDEDHTSMIEQLALCKLVREPSPGERVWPMWNLTEETITAIAKRNGVSLTGRDFDEIARGTKKGFDAALDFVWEEAIIGAIRSTKPEWKFEVMSHELIDKSTFTSGSINSCYEEWKGEID